MGFVLRTEGDEVDAMRSLVSPHEEARDDATEWKRERAEILAQKVRELEEAHREGFASGRAAADAEYANVVRPWLEQAVAAVTEAAFSANELIEAASVRFPQIMCEHAISLTRALVGQHYKADPGSIMQIAKPVALTATAEAREGHEVTFLAHPDTVAALKTFLADLQLPVIASDEIQPGGFKVTMKDVSLNRIVAEWDATLERRIGSLGQTP